jgi:uncharacterized glyoxalase superfamily protein PhnB
MGIHPTLRYTDAKAGIDFLVTALGFAERHRYLADDGTVTHAELAFDGDVVMVGTRTDPPAAFDTGTASNYLAIAEGTDIDALHDRAVAAGATVLSGLVDQDYGSREFAVADPEGNVWSVGTYRPS